MTEKQKQMICAMRQQGIAYSTIADAFGLSLNTVKSFCRRENIDIKSNPDDEIQNLCKNCGIPLMNHPGTKKKTFCSNKCRYSWWNKNSLSGVKSAYHHNCFHCGAVFYSKNKNSKYCGCECYIHSRYGEGLP